MNFENRSKEIGRRIKFEREALGLTQKQLLEMVFMSSKSTASVRNYEQGKQLPDMETMCRMCDIFDCDFGYLIGDYQEKRRVTADVCAQTGLSEEAVKKLMKYREIYPGCVEAVSSLLEARTGEGVLVRLSKFEKQLSQLAELLDIEAKAPHIKASSDGKRYIYPDDFSIAHDNRVEFEAKVDLLEYKLDTQFRYLLEELREKAEGKEKVKNGKSDRTPG